MPRVVIVMIGYCAYVGAVAALPLDSRATGVALRPQAVAGQKVWRVHGCTSCHSMYGLGGHTGPDLTNAWSRLGREYVQTVLRDGVRAMPGFALTDAETVDLLAYLEDADATGVYPPRTNFAPVFGVGR